MSIQTYSRCNLAATRVDWESANGLLLPKTFTATQTLVSNIISFFAPKAVRVRLIFSLVSGGITMNLARHSGTPNFTSGANCVTSGSVTDADPASNNTHVGHFIDI